MMIIGGVAVLGALLFLFRAISSESPAATVTATPGARPEAPAQTSAPAAPSLGGPAARPTPIKPRVESTGGGGAGGGGGGAAPTLVEEDAPPATKLNTKNINWGAPQIRELIAANEPHVKECIRTNGGGASGEAVTTYIVAQKGDKVVIEETSADSDKTTLKNEALVECLHKTATQMKFVGLPRQADAIIVTRSITVTDGALAEDKMVKFNYIR